MDFFLNLYNHTSIVTAMPWMPIKRHSLVEEIPQILDWLAHNQAYELHMSCTRIEWLLLLNFRTLLFMQACLIIKIT